MIRATLLLASLLLAPAGAEAHASLVASVPAPRATLRRSPARVDLTFSERLEPAYSTVSVWDGAGARVDARDGSVSGQDPRRLTVTLPPLLPGRYVIRFRVLSVDGHLVEAEFPFTIKGDGGGTPPR